MRRLLVLLLLIPLPAHARRLDAIVDAAREILVAQASRPRPHPGGPMLCVAVQTPNQITRLPAWPTHGQWLWCFPADAPPWWQGPWWQGPWR